MFENQNEITDLGISPISIVKVLGKRLDTNLKLCAIFINRLNMFPDPRELSSEKKNLMIFDDLLLEKQNTCESYYVRGRNSNVDCFYLAQHYFKLPRQTIRENANFICLFPKTWRTLTTFSMIMWDVTWQGRNSDNYARQLEKNSIDL